MKRIIILILLFTVSIEMMFSLDVRDGLVRIATDDLTVRPMLYRLVNVAGKSKYEPLWFDGDPRTSFIVLDVDGRIYRMGSSQDFQTIQRRISNGVEIEYKSIIMRVTQRITFASLVGSRVSNGFAIELEIENFTTRDMKVKLKEVCDTWLGEKIGNHFALKSNSNVVDEMLLDSTSNEPYIISPGQNASIALLLNVPQKPDSVVIANWKRLSDSQFAYDSELMRGFTLAPYSTNDSALGLYWNERIVPAKGTIRVASIWLTGGPGSEFVPWLAQNYTLAVSQKTTASPNAASSQPVPSEPQPTAISPSIALNVNDIQALINKIDNALQNIDTLSDEDLATILNELDTMSANSNISTNPSNQ